MLAWELTWRRRSRVMIGACLSSSQILPKAFQALSVEGGCCVPKGGGSTRAQPLQPCHNFHRGWITKVWRDVRMQVSLTCIIDETRTSLLASFLPTSACGGFFGRLARVEAVSPFRQQESSGRPSLGTSWMSSWHVLGA